MGAEQHMGVPQSGGRCAVFSFSHLHGDILGLAKVLPVALFSCYADLWALPAAFLFGYCLPPSMRSSIKAMFLFTAAQSSFSSVQRMPGT